MLYGYLVALIDGAFSSFFLHQRHAPREQVSFEPHCDGAVTARKVESRKETAGERVFRLVQAVFHIAAQPRSSPLSPLSLLLLYHPAVAGCEESRSLSNSTAAEP